MRTLSIFLLSLVIASGCEVIIVEPVYDPRDKFVGNYEFEEYSETWDEILTYHISIRKSSHDDHEVYIKNFYGASINVYAFVEDHHITIPFQEVDMYEIEGSGTWIDGEISFTYYVHDLLEDVPADFCQGLAW